MDLEWIEQLTQRMRASGIERLSCRMDGTAMHLVLPATATAASDNGLDSVSPPARAAQAAITVQAPGFGRFHPVHPLAQELGVVLGKSVKIGEPLGYLEVCGVMTALTATSPGQVQTIQAQAGDWVQYGQPLIELRAA